MNIGQLDRCNCQDTGEEKQRQQQLRRRGPAFPATITTTTTTNMILLHREGRTQTRVREGDVKVEDCWGLARTVVGRGRGVGSRGEEGSGWVSAFLLAKATFTGKCWQSFLRMRYFGIGMLGRNVYQKLSSDNKLSLSLSHPFFLLISFIQFWIF